MFDKEIINVFKIQRGLYPKKEKKIKDGLI